MQFVIPNHAGFSWKQVLCYYGAFFQKMNCPGPDTNQLVFYYSDNPTTEGIHAPFQVQDFLKNTIALAKDYSIPIIEKSDFLPVHDKLQFKLNKEIVIIHVDDDSHLDLTNAVLLRPSRQLYKRATNATNNTSANYVDVSTSLSFFLLTTFGFIMTVILGVQFLASAAPSMTAMSYGSRLKSD